MLSGEERDILRARVRARARPEAERNPPPGLADDVRANAKAIAEQDARIDAQDALLNALQAGIATAFEAAGRGAPPGLQPEEKRPELKLLQGGAA